VGVVTNYTLDLAAGLTQVLADGTNVYLYGAGRIGEDGPAGWAYHLPDALGSVRQLVDGTGAVALAQSYKPYGDVLSSAGAGGSAYGYTGEWTDGNGLVFLRARYYVPTWGAFLSRDPIMSNYKRPVSLNGYNYAESNPILLTDPSGEVCVPCLVLVLAGATVLLTGDTPTGPPSIHKATVAQIEQIANEYNVPPIMLGAALRHQGDRLGKGSLFRGDLFMAIDEEILDLDCIPYIGPVLFGKSRHSYGIGQQTVQIAHEMGFHSATPWNLRHNEVLNIQVMAAKLAKVDELLTISPPPNLDRYILHSIAQNASASSNMPSLVSHYKEHFWYRKGGRDWSVFFNEGKNYRGQSGAILTNIRDLHEIDWFRQNWPLSSGVNLQDWEEMLGE